MPQIIREYQQQVGVAGVPSAAARVRNPEAQSSGFMALAQVAQVIAHNKEQDAAAEAAVTLSKTQSEWQNQFLKRQEEADPGMPGFTETLLKDYDEYTTKAINESKTRQSKLFLKEGFARQRATLAENALNAESVARVAHRKAQFADGVEMAATNAELDPNSYQERLAEQLALLDVLDVPPVEKEAMKDAATEMVQGRAAVGVARTDPEGAMKRLVTPEAGDTLFRTLSPKSRDAVLQEAENAQRIKVNQEDRAYMLAERAERDASDNKEKEGHLLVANAGMSMGWVTRNQAVLTPDAIRYFSQKAAGIGGDGTTNAEVYAGLRLRAGRGEDVREEAHTALLRGSIQPSDFDRIVGEVESDRQGWYDRGTDYLISASGYSELNPTPDAGMTKARMLDDWQVWADRNPKATDDEARSAYTRIADEYSIIDREKISLSLRRPLYMNDRNNPDIEATEAETVKAFTEKRISAQEFQEQALLIAKWKAALANQPKPKAPK